MTPAARVAAAIEVLDLIVTGTPAEKALTGWGRSHRFAGSGDRLALRDLVFDALRCRRSLGVLGGADTGRGLMLGALRRDGADIAAIFSGTGYAPAPVGPLDKARDGPLTDAERLDLPDWLYPLFAQPLGPHLETVLRAMQARAPVFLRVNLARGTRAAAVAALAADGITSLACPNIRTALEVTHNQRKIQTSRAYLVGLVELQDAASQAAVLRLPLRDGQRVLDFCAGGGGKVLAIAGLGRAALFAHDADPRRMADLPARALRAGALVSVLTTQNLPASGLFDLVLVDAPCSGSGTWRRSPDAKWRLTPADLDRLCAVQAQILQQALRRVSPGGCLAYATCSVLNAENQGQIARLLAAHPGLVLREVWQNMPSAVGDGFYLAQMGWER